MSTMIQIRNVPRDMHRILKTRAAQRGMTLSDFLLREIAEIARRPTVDEWLEQVAARQPATDLKGSARAVRAEREGRR